MKQFRNFWHESSWESIFLRK